MEERLANLDEFLCSHETRDIRVIGRLQIRLMKAREAFHAGDDITLLLDAIEADAKTALGTLGVIL